MLNALSLLQSKAKQELYHLSFELFCAHLNKVLPFNIQLNEAQLLKIKSKLFFFVSENITHFQKLCFVFFTAKQKLHSKVTLKLQSFSVIIYRGVESGQKNLSPANVLPYS